MKKLVLVMLIFLSVAACKVNPFTGKKVLNFYPNSQIFPMAFAQYDQFLTENNVVENSAESKMITKV
ncbi:MAG: M48 family peptidase, partial [Aurantibacter sp.]